ncbi:MAG TPA: oligosaccharide flippase family protein [Bacteroidota bacterium]|nr:oligosaccharide flippase family protein [Bacteroidota bacterium]
MLQHLKRLGTETATYGVSTIVGRFLNFLLVPFYTNVLLPGEYGVVTYVYSIIAFVNVLYAYGMESAFFKYASTREMGGEKQNFSTAFLSLALTSAVLTLVVCGAKEPIGAILRIPADALVIVYYSAGMLAFDTLSIIPFAILRMEHRARQFAAIKIVNIVINVVMNVVLLVYFRSGITGIFLSGFTASVVTFLILAPTIVRHLELHIRSGLLRALLRFGLPSIPAGLAAMAVQVIDRPILRSLTDDATVGIYQANYRLGIFMMLIVQMYDYAWRPFYFALAQTKDAKQVFARVLTYLVLFMSLVFLLLLLFLDEVVHLQIFGRHLIHPGYWSGLPIVPVVLGGYFFLGVYTNISAGIYIEKKTIYLPFITLFAAVINIVANYLLIPSFGMAGAAWATFWAYLGMAAAGYAVVRKIYPVSYEWGRIAKILLALAVVTGISYAGVGAVASPALRIFAKIGLVALFAGSLAAMRFFRAGELSALTRLVRSGMPGGSDASTGTDSPGPV